MELGQAGDASYLSLVRMTSVVGLDLVTRAYPSGSPLRDAGHRELLERFRALLPVGTPWQTEVPLPSTGDLRAWDARIRLWRLLVGVEAEVKLTDTQALERRAMQKRRDGGVDRMILVLAGTRSNRRILASSPTPLLASFPLQGRSALRALRGPLDPGADLLVLA